jgi:hypothetical protein
MHGAITVKEADGTPSFTDISEIQFDQADGFVVSQPSAGKVKIDLSGGGSVSIKDVTHLGAKVHRNSGQSLNNTTLTAIQFNNETYDTDACHDNATNNTRLTAPFTGYYLVGGHAQFEANATGVRLLTVGVNGTVGLDNVQWPAPSGAGITANADVSTVLQLTAGDYVELFAWQNSGGTLNVELANFWIAMVGK